MREAFEVLVSGTGTVQISEELLKTPHCDGEEPTRWEWPKPISAFPLDVKGTLKALPHCYTACFVKMPSGRIAHRGHLVIREWWRWGDWGPTKWLVNKYTNETYCIYKG